MCWLCGLVCAFGELGRFESLDVGERDRGLGDGWCEGGGVERKEERVRGLKG